MAVNDIKLDISRYIFPIKANEIFNNNKKTALEVGFGEGEFLVELASTERTDLTRREYVFW